MDRWVRILRIRGSGCRRPAILPVAPLLLLRLLGAALGAMAVAATGVAANVVFGRADLAIAVAACVAFLPQFTFIVTSVSNDSLVVALGAVMVSLLARSRTRSLYHDPHPATHPVGWARYGAAEAVCMGVVAGLAAITKLTLLPISFLVVLYRPVGSRYVRHWVLAGGAPLWWRDRVRAQMATVRASACHT